MALTAYDVLDGRTSPAKALAGMLENEAIDTVFVGVQAATLWLAAKALAGGSAVAVSGVAASATTGAAAAVPALAPVAGGKLGGIAAVAPLNDFVAYGAAGLAGVATALATTALTWGYRRYEATALARTRWEGLVLGAERSLDPARPRPRRRRRRYLPDNRPGTSRGSSSRQLRAMTRTCLKRS